MRDEMSGGPPKGVELATREKLHNDYIQQGECALNRGTADVYQQDDAQLHRKRQKCFAQLPSMDTLIKEWILMIMFTEIFDDDCSSGKMH